MVPSPYTWRVSKAAKKLRYYFKKWMAVIESDISYAINCVAAISELHTQSNYAGSNILKSVLTDIMRHSATLTPTMGQLYATGSGTTQH